MSSFSDPYLEPLSSSTTYSSSSSNSWLAYLAEVSWKTWILVILVLSFFGINVLGYLAKGTAETTSLFKQWFGPVLSFFGFGTLEVSKQIVTGVKGGVDTVADASVAGINAVETSFAKTADTATATPSSSSVHSFNHDALNKALSNYSSSSSSQEVMPSQSTSSVIYSGKAGWCLIGDSEPEGRVCSSVGANDTCMSGDIFPTREVCVNPSLRA